MNPLDETLRGSAAAVSGRSGAHGGKDRSAGEPGAFENAVADAGRQKQHGRGSTSSGTQDAGTANDTTQADLPIAGRRAGLQVASDAIEAKTQLGTQDGAADDQPSEDIVTGRQKALTRLRQLAERTTPEGAGAAEAHEEHALKAAAKWGGHPSTRDAATGEAGDGETVAANAAEPATETVSDLLALLGGGHPVTGAAAEGRAIRVSGDRAATAQSEKPANGASAIAADDPQAAKSSDEAGSDRLFRFARADGKGKAVSMNISKDGERVAIENSKSSAQSKAETVTVLEARRYLGVAMNANSASVTGAIAGDGEWARALQSGQALAQPEAWNQAGKTLNTLKIQMHPIDLGMVTATLRLKDDELHVELKVETGDALRQLRDDQGEMVKALRAQGFAVDQVNVTLAGGGDASTGNGSQQQAQSQLGQSGRERAGGGDGEGRRPQDGGQVAAGEGWTGNDGTDDAPTGAERPRAGYVYM